LDLNSSRLLSNIDSASSDNGPVINDGYLDHSVETSKAEHYKPAGIYRGGKYSAFEGGTRVPMIVYLANKIKPNTVSNALFTQIDLMASFAKMLNQKLGENEFTDSRDYFSTLTGEKNESSDFIIEQPENMALAIVKDGWKYITPSNGPALMTEVNIESGYSKEDQLYNLKYDPRELHNLALKNPDKLAALKNLLKKTENNYK
jgi:arylsulfatase A-like enzyme